jgi:hypothetical protein
MNVGTIVCSGFTGGEARIGTIRLKPSDVEAASDTFASTYILKMGLHYDRYVVSGALPNFQAVPAVYTAAMLAARSTSKGRATSVTGNIGESIAALVARRKLNAKLVKDVLPVIASTKAKTPDFTMRLRPMFPGSFQAAVGANHAIGFGRWPVESKAVETDGRVRSALRKALIQLGTYWYERYPFEPSVCGYGIVVCLIYRSAPRRIRVHVLTPRNQAAFQGAIAQHRQANTKAAYITELTTANAKLRGYLNDLD